jgi:hypothetical protein
MRLQMYKISTLVLNLLCLNSSNATSINTGCIFPKNPLEAKVLASGKLVHSLWTGKLYFIRQRNWNVNFSKIEVADDCDNNIKRQAGKSFLYFNSNENRSEQLTIDSNIIPFDSLHAKATILKFAKINNFVGEINPSWQFCEADNECIQVKNQCGNTIGINKDFSLNYFEFLKSKKIANECSKSKSVKNEIGKPECIDNFCNEPDVKVRTFFGFTL